MALQILDGSDMRGSTIHVERAKFELKGQFDPSKKKRKLTNKEKKKFQEKQEKWEAICCLIKLILTIARITPWSMVMFTVS